MAERTFPVRSGGVGLITISGGDCSLLVDLCDATGLELPEPSRETQTKISSLMKKPLSLANPLDVEDLWSAEPEAFKSAVRSFAADPALEMVACRFNLPKTPSPSLIEMYRGSAQAIRSSGKEPVFLTRASEQLDEAWFEFFSSLSTPFLLEYGKSLQAIKNYVDFQRRNERPGAPSHPAAPAPRFLAFREAVTEVRQSGKRILPYRLAKALLGAYGVSFAPDALVSSESEALEAASGIGYPVALKLLSPHLPHKSEAGGVALNVSGPGELSLAYRRIRAAAEKSDSSSEIEGVLVQPMISEGVEIMAGIFRDPLLGPSVLVGLGGIFTEVLNDVSVRVPPVSRAEARAMVRELKGAAVLAGARGRPVRDVGRLGEILVALGELARDFEEVVEAVDLNPVMVLPEGKGALAVDLLVVLTEES
jgi:acetyltransferase